MQEKQYKLKINELLLLKNNINNENLLKKIKISFLIKQFGEKNKNIYSIRLTLEECKILLDELTFLFTLKGIDNNSEPNDFGMQIEELIDIFSK